MRQRGLVDDLDARRRPPTARSCDRSGRRLSSPAPLRLKSDRREDVRFSFAACSASRPSRKAAQKTAQPLAMGWPIHHRIDTCIPNRVDAPADGSALDTGEETGFARLPRRHAKESPTMDQLSPRRLNARAERPSSRRAPMSSSNAVLAKLVYASARTSSRRASATGFSPWRSRPATSSSTAG